MAVPIRSTDFQPPFPTLPTIPGCPDVRWVGTTIMDAEEYTICGWHVVGTYPVNDVDIYVWAAEFDGLRRYGEMQASRRAATRQRVRERAQEDAAWRERVDASDDAKPDYR